MSEMTNFLENAILDHILGGAVYTQPTQVRLALSTTVIADDGSGITEPSWTGYTRTAITFGAASGGQSQNTNQIDFAHGGGGTETIVATAIYDQGANMLYYDNDFIDTPVANGETLRFQVGGITVTQD